MTMNHSTSSGRPRQPQSILRQLSRLRLGLMAVMFWALVVGPAVVAAAQFTTKFDDVTAGSALTVSWKDVPDEYYPLCITAQLIERQAEGTRVNAYKANVTSMCDLFSVFASSLMLGRALGEVRREEMKGELSLDSRTRGRCVVCLCQGAC